MPLWSLAFAHAANDGGPDVNGFGRLNDLKADLAGVASITDLDAILNRFRERVSREFEAEVNRSFVAISDTRYFHGDGNAILLFRSGDDLVSLSSLKLDVNGDGTFGTTLVENTDWHYWPRNAANQGKPYRGIQLNPNGQYGAFPAIPRYVQDGNVQAVGIWGYSFEKQSVGTLGAAIATTSATSVTMTAGHDVQIGDTLVIDDEQFDVTAVSTNTLTVTRGLNGTTAATHLNGATVYCRRYPRDVEMAIAERVVGLRWASQGGYQDSAVLAGEGAGSSRASFARWKNAITRYTNPAGVI